jgi:hypothetical protein
MQTGLFSLEYESANVGRYVYYEDSPRRIGTEDARLNPDRPPGSTAGLAPDSWPYADQALLLTRYEGSDTVRVYATRSFPFARFEVAATPPTTTCDLAVSEPVPVPASNGFTFTVSTSHGPWSSSLSLNAANFVEGKNTYLLPPGDYEVYVRDAAGCQQMRTATVLPTGPAAPTPAPGNPTAGMILLRHRPLPSLKDKDLFRIKEEYYDPKTRKAYFFAPPDSADGVPYSRPVTEIIDRWCVDPGNAPYREVQVTHDGQGGVTFTNVDGVTACMAFCTLAATLTPSALLEGRGTLTAAATGAQGPVLFSFDGFDTPGLPGTPDPATGLPTYVLRNQKAGTYTVTAKETRTGGCVATASATLVAAYGPRYEHRFRDRDNVACRLRIFQREYTGLVEQVKGQPGAVVVEWPGSATDHVFTNLVRGSSCEMALYMAYVEQMLPLFSGDERLHRVEYERNGQLFWKGYVLPEQYEVAFLTPPATFGLSATDGLGTLSTVPFVGTVGEALRGDWSLLQLLQFLLAKLDLDLPLNVLFGLYPSTAKLGTGALEQIKVDVSQYQDEKGKAWDCGKILTQVLTTFAARLYQQQGAWWLERLSDLTTEEMTYARYAPGGVRGPDVRRTLLVEVRPPAEKLLRWKEKSQRQSLLPAVSTITVLADPGEPANLLARATPRNTDLPGALPASWSASPGPAASSLVYQGKDKPPVLRLVGTTDFAKTPERGAWVQTPKSVAVPLRNLGNTNPYNGTLTLSFTAKPYGNTPAELEADQTSMYAAVNFGGLWVAPYLAFPGETPDVEKVLFQSYVRFADSKEVKVSVRGYGASPQGPQPIYVRFYQPVGGKSVTTVDISDIELTWENQALETAETYTTEYRADTGALVSRVDEATTLFHSDTRYARRQGTLLDGASLPVQGWYEAAQPGILLEAGDYLVIYRNFWQRNPAQMLTGGLLGQLDGPGALLTDPKEARPGVYVLTSATHDGPHATWQLTAVQLRTLAAPDAGLPAHAIYHEDLTAFTREDGTIMTYEHA